jgi:hypothetical protein
MMLLLQLEDKLDLKEGRMSGTPLKPKAHQATPRSFKPISRSAYRWECNQAQPIVM